MSEWPVHTLGDICEELTVGHVGSMASQYISGGVPFLRSQNVRTGRLDLNNLTFISEEFHQKLRKSQLRSGDIVIVRTGEPGAAAVIPDGIGSLNCSDLVIARPSPRVDSRYLCYSINATAKQYIAAQLVGAVQQHFNVGSARKVPVALPPLYEQRGIASVLGALDDKIAVNDRIMTVAESLVAALAAEVQGSASVPLSQLVRHVRDQVSPDNFGTEVVAHYSLPAFDLGRVPELVAPTSIKSGKFAITSRCVLVSKLNPSIPRVWDLNALPTIPALASTEFVVLEPIDGVSAHEIWAICSQPSFNESLASQVTGTSNSHQRVRPPDMLATSVVDPRRIPNRVRGQICSLSDKVSAARQESLSLAMLRDYLLPRLLSRAIRVRCARELVEDAT